ncbi:MAG: J domain-containing protein, partial [Novosphingobium sp.]
SVAMWKRVRHDRFHGRHESRGRMCDAPGCGELGEFRAPGIRAGSFDGPGDYRWFCLDHIRAFNAGYDFFAGMSTEEILRAQSPLAGWETETRAFRPTCGVGQPPRWADFAGSLDAISRRARARHPAERQDGIALSPDERRALETLGLSPDADRKALRRRYSELVHQYHPDRNGGDRSLEWKLQGVVQAYQLLRKTATFA